MILLELYSDNIFIWISMIGIVLFDYSTII